MPDDSFLWGRFTWNIAGARSFLKFFASGAPPVDMVVLMLKQEVANDE